MCSEGSKQMTATLGRMGAFPQVLIGHNRTFRVKPSAVLPTSLVCRGSFELQLEWVWPYGTDVQNHNIKQLSNFGANQLLKTSVQTRFLKMALLRCPKPCAEEAAAKSQAQEIRGGGQDCCLASIQISRPQRWRYGLKTAP